MRLTVVGCSGPIPGRTRPRAATCSRPSTTTAPARTWRVLLDLGSGALGALHRYADPLSIDAVLLSHLHADHCLDLAGYYVLRKYHPSGAQPRIPVWGPVGTADRLARAYDLPLDPGMNDEFDFRRVGRPDRGRPVLRAAGRGRPPGAGVRPAGLGRRRRRGLQRRHRSVPGAGHGRGRGGPDARRGVVPGRRRQPAPPAPHRRRLRRAFATRAGCAGWCSPTSRRGTTPRTRSTRPARSTPARSSFARAGATYEPARDRWPGLSARASEASLTRRA